MKTYEVELKRTSYVVVTVEAEGEDAAQDLAWQHVAEDARYGNPNDAQWEIESIEEVTK